MSVGDNEYTISVTSESNTTKIYKVIVTRAEEEESSSTDVKNIKVKGYNLNVERFKNNGNDPTRRDLKLVEDLLIDYKLKPGVVNVLIDYVLNVNEKKLTRGLVEMLAGEWQRLGIETVEDAMKVAEKEHKKRSKKNIKVEVKGNKTPDWFDKEITKEKIDSSEDNQLEELLKEYK